MAEHRWKLIDPEQDLCRDLAIDGRELPGTPPGWSVTKRTLQTGLSRGVELVEIDNGRLKIAVVPTRGMGIWRAWIDGQTLGWKSPVRGPVHPAYVPIGEPNGLGWVSGFDELMCRCGMDSNGAPDFDERGQLRYSLHGRVANLPACYLELVIDDSLGTITLHGQVEETRFHFQKLRLHTTLSTRFESSSVSWHDEVENFGGQPTEMQMMYHTNIGLPQLDAGSRLHMPVSQVAPGTEESARVGTDGWHEYSGPQAGFIEQCYYFRLLGDEAGETRILLKNAAASSGVGMRFNLLELPCFTLWKNMVAEADGYVTGLEPGTNYPNPRTSEGKKGRVVSLQPSARWQATVTLDWLSQPAELDQAEQAIAQLQGSHEPSVLAEL